MTRVGMAMRSCGADHGLFGRVGGAVNRDVLAEDVAVADAEACGLAAVLNILGRFANDRAGVEMVCWRQS